MPFSRCLSASRPLSVAAAVVACLAPAAGAATLDFDFSFTNDPRAGGGLVTGIIRGLEDDATSAASSVEVLSNELGFGIGEYVGGASGGSFTVVNGQITGAVFSGFGNLNTPPAVTTATLSFATATIGGDITITAGLRNAGGAGYSYAAPDLTFTRVQPPAVIPLPAAGWLLMGGLSALAVLGARRRRPA